MEWKRGNIWNNNGPELLKMNNIPPTTNPGSSDNTKQNKYNIKQVKNEWKFSSVERENIHQVWILYLAKLSFKSKEIKTFWDKQSRGFITSKPVWQEMLKDILQAEGKWYTSET